MNRVSTFIATAWLGASILVPHELRAQSANGLRVAAGAVAGQGSGVGVQLSSSYGFMLPMHDFTLRLEGNLSMWQRLRVPSAYAPRRIANVGLSVERSFGNARLRPFLVAGGGVYAQPGSHLSAGASGGGGLRYQLTAISLVSELRMHTIEGTAGRRLVPLTFGIQF